MIKPIEMFAVYCDNCGAIWIDDYTGFCAFADKSTANDSVQDAENWHTTPDEKHYCDKCFKGVDDNDNVLLAVERKDHHNKTPKI
jgi:hypothetical protein